MTAHDLPKPADVSPASVGDGLRVARLMGPKGYRFYVLAGKRVLGSARTLNSAMGVRKQVAANRAAIAQGKSA